MPDGDGNGEKVDTPPARQRKPKREMELYRPGMLRRGTDVTVGAEPPSGSKPPEEPPVKKPPRIPNQPRTSGRVTDSSRRKSNDTDSVHSYRNDSGSTTPDAASICSERRSYSGRGGSRTFTRGGGGGSYRNNDVFDDGRSDYSTSSYRSNNHGYAGYDSRNASQMSSRQGSRDDVTNDRYRGPNQPYNSTQSLYDSRQPGGYLDSRPSPRKYEYHRRDYTSDQSSGPGTRGGSRFPRNAAGPFTRDNERASMRAEVGQRRVGARRRNDSINSTQSERPPTNVELRVDTGLDSQSQSGDAPSSTTMDYMELCKSFESMGTFDWSKEMEMECNEKLKEEEERNARELQERLEACENGLDVQKVVSQQRGPVRGIIRLNISDDPTPAPNTSASPRGRDECSQNGSRGRGAGRGRGRGGHRVRRDSDRSSSFGGSIAEEVESEGEEDELASGERTPTRERQPDSERRWSSRGGRNTSYGRSPKRNPGNGFRSARYQENHDPRDDYSDGPGRGSYSARDPVPSHSKYRGGHDFSREEAPPSRLQGRLTIQPNTITSSLSSGDVRQQNGPRARELASSGPRDRTSSSQSLAQRRDSEQQASECVTSAQPQKDIEISQEPEGEDGEMPREMPRSMAEWPIYKEIARKEGPVIKKINDEVTRLLPRVAQRRDISSAEHLLSLSSELSEVYFGLLTRDVQFTFAQNLEQHLWKQAYHKAIESLKTASNSVKDGAKPIRAVLLRLLTAGISFYTRLISFYESEFDLDLSQLLVWPGGLPTDDLRTVVPAPLPVNRLASSKQKTAVKSCSRHLIALGDLCRYKTLVEGSEDYSLARSWYLKASQLWPSSGHAYNQLAVVAFYSERVLDEIFFCIRSLSAGHSFDAAKDRLAARFAAMAKKVSKYETLLDSECGRIRRDDSFDLLLARDRPREIWIAVEGGDSSASASSSTTMVTASSSSTSAVTNSMTESTDSSQMMTYLEQSPSQLHRRSISYIVHMVGLLVTKIGMEQFESVSERAIGQLAALIRQPDSPLSSQQLVQISLLFIYAVHTTAIKGDADSCSVQQQLAVQSLLSLLGVLIDQLMLGKDTMTSSLDGRTPVPKQCQRVLPAICVLCEWLSCPQASAFYRTMPNIEPLPISTVKIDTWASLTACANQLVSLKGKEGEGARLGRLEETEGSVCCILPELLLVSSFLSIFPSSPRFLHVTMPSTSEPSSQEESTTQSASPRLPVHARLLCTLQAAEYLGGSDLNCFCFDEKTGQFRKLELSDEDDLSGRLSEATLDPSSTSPQSPADLTRQQLLEREQRKRKGLIVVRPKNLILDTNALVDHLDSVQKIVQSDRFQVIIPTIVIEELLGLSQTRPGEAGSAHGERVSNEARRGVAWLREQARLKTQRMNTLTTQGQKLVICIVNENTGDYVDGKINDDHILSSVVSLVDRLPTPVFDDFTLPPSDDVTPLFRNCVLISEDRGICIKANSQNIPTRSVPSFMKWANIA